MDEKTMTDEPQENRLHRARRFIQAVKGDLRNATHISMLQTAIDDIQAALAQSDAEPQNVRDAAENLLIAIGMGWDLDGCVENLRAALAQSDAGPVATDEIERLADQERLAEMRELATLYQEEDVSDAYPGISEELTWAADEIERLAKENNFLQLQLNALRDLWAERDEALAQPNAEPGSPWAIISRYESTAKKLREEPTLLSNEEKIEWMEEFCEELRAAFAQSDAEPVAWQYREPNGEWQMCDAATDIYYQTSKYEIRRLYAALPRPDASAGLMQAALEQALDCIRGETPEDMSHEEARQDTIDKIREALRARVADRNAK